MPDPFDNLTVGLESPAEDDFEITPSDEDDLPQVTRGIFVGTGGDLACVLRKGDSTIPHTYKNLADGTWYPFRVKKVFETGTTAQDLVGLL